MKAKTVKVLSVLIAVAVTLVLTLSILTVPTAAAVNYSFFDKDDIDPSTYAYSFALIGDTQTISIKDVQNAGKEGYESKVEALYKWIVDNKDSKKIKFVMGLGDIVETWQTSADYKDVHDAEWALNAKAIAQLDAAKIPYTLVRGNHDTDSSFNNWVKTEMGAYQSQFNGINGEFMYSDKYDTSYQKININGNKWLIMALDWAVTGAELDWAAEVIRTNSDHKVILTMHNYLNHDMTIDANGDTQDSGYPNPGWDYSIDPTSPDNDPDLVYNPDGIWYRLVSKHENISMVISGHHPNDSVQRSQVIGDNGNTITQLLVDPQGMDKNSKYNGGNGLGMVCMLYFSEDGETVTVGDWDGSTVHMEWYSTVLDQYFRDDNQVTLDLDLYDGATNTAYGKIPAEYADSTFALFGYDSDIDEYFFHAASDSWNDENGIYRALSRFSGKKPKATILLLKDYEINDSEAYAISSLGVNVDIDLNGHSITVTGAEKCFLSANIAKANTNNIRVFGKEGSALINKSKWTPFINMGASGTACVGSVTNITFDGITFKYGESASAEILVAQTFNMASTNNSPVTAEQNLVFNNCTFDLKTYKPDKNVKLFQLNETVGEGYNVQIANVEINGGEIIASNLTDAAIFTKNDNDTVSLGGADGNVPKITLDEGILTNYGTVPEKWANESEFPYLVFFNGEAIGAKTTLVDAFNLAKGKLTAENSFVAIYVRKTGTEALSASCLVSSADVKGTLKIDLNNNTLTTSKKAVFQLNAKDSGKFSLEVTNGTLNSVRLIALSTQTNVTDPEKAQQFDITFKDLTLGLTASHWDEMIATNESATYTGLAHSNITFENCNLDLNTNQGKDPYTLMQLSTDKNNHKTTVTFKGGEIIRGEKAVTLYTAGATVVDTVSFEKDASGDYTTFTQPSGAAPTDTYGNANFSYKLISDDDTTAKYMLGADDYVAGYGYVPFAYADNAAYPFALFQGNKFVAVFNTWYSVLDAFTNNKVDVDWNPDEKITLALRRDYSTTECGKNSQYVRSIQGTLNIDLNNHTLTRGSYHLFQLIAKATAPTDSSTINIKNGTIENNASMAIFAINTNSDATKSHTFNITVDNVTFKLGASATTDNLIFVTFDGKSNSGTDITTTVSAEFNNCVFDLSSVAPSKMITLFKLSDKDVTRKAATVTVNGGKIKAANTSYLTISALSEGDSVVFSNNNGGKYTSLIIPANQKAPSNELNGLVFVKTGATGNLATYTLMPKSIITFAPKTSVTLYTDFRYNIYLPKSAALTAVKLGDEVLDLGSLEIVKLGGSDYYRLPYVALESLEALRDIDLTVTLTDNGNSYMGSFTLGLYKYASGVISGNYSEVEKTLAKDMLSYVRAAYSYFENADKSKIAAVDALLGDNYDLANAPDMSVSAKTPSGSGFTSVTFHLGESPAYRFYYSGATAPECIFRVGSRTVGVTTGKDTVGSYVEVKVYAYEILSGISFTNGANNYEYNVYSYYAQASASVKPLVERLVKYCESANAYRDSVIAEN